MIDIIDGESKTRRRHQAYEQTEQKDDKKTKQQLLSIDTLAEEKEEEGEKVCRARTYMFFLEPAHGAGAIAAVFRALCTACGCLRQRAKLTIGKVQRARRDAGRVARSSMCVVRSGGVDAPANDRPDGSAEKVELLNVQACHFLRLTNQRAMLPTTTISPKARAGPFT